MKKLVISHLPLAIVLFALVLLVAPLFVSAATMPGIPYWGSFVSCTGTAGSCSLNDLVQTFLNIISFGITISLFFLAPALFAWGGIMLMIAGGDPGKAAQGKKIITGTVIGVAIILLSYVIIKVFVGAIGIIGIGGFS